MKKPSLDSVEQRRYFLRMATTSVGVALTAPMIAALVSSCETDETQPNAPAQSFELLISDYPDLAVLGGIADVIISGLNSDQPVFVTRISDTMFAVFSSVCTHRGCLIDLPSQAGDNCRCPCHGAEYSSQDGSILVQPNVDSATDLRKFDNSYNSTTQILTING